MMEYVCLIIGKVGTIEILIERDRERDWRSVDLIDRERPEQPSMFRGPNLGRPLGDFRCFSSEVILALSHQNWVFFFKEGLQKEAGFGVDLPLDPSST